MNEGKNMEVTGVQNNVTGNLTAGLINEGNAELNARNANVKVIKRYQNRKLYDTHQSCYVTLDEIADMIMRGEDVVVVDNRTKKDITSSTLTQIIFEKQKRSKTVIPVNTLRDIIQVGGGTFSGFLTKTAESGNNVLNKAKADLEKNFIPEENLRGAFLITQRAAEDLRRAIDEKAQNSGLSREALNATHIQLQNLNSQLSNLEKLIEVFEARASNA
ncbi:MAG: polyhydroxyalkanoate synthesis regulator DNA-binding domain-containing protein [Bdellovibrionota bacterium]